MKLKGLFGSGNKYGGMYVPETLMPALEELETAYLNASQNTVFLAELDDLLANYAGPPTPLYKAENLSRLAGCQIYLKREDLLHGGAHKTNNALGQALLAKRMGKKRLIAETGAGQHGVACAMAGALLGLPTEIYMGEVDIERQKPNVFRMKLLGATVHPVSTGSRTLKDAINEALRDWITNLETTHYLLGTAAGPHPFPSMVKFFQKVIGDEARAQFLKATNRLPDAVVACVGGGSNAIGIFSAFLADEKVQLIGVEPGGEGIASGKHGAVLAEGRPGCLHGMRSMILQDEDGQVQEAHSIAAGLDYPSVGPEHAYLKEEGRASYVSITDQEALSAFHLVARNEGIIPALESSHAVAYALKLGPLLNEQKVNEQKLKGQESSKNKSTQLKSDNGESNEEAAIIVNLSGRGDKDLQEVMKYESL